MQTSMQQKFSARIPERCNRQVARLSSNASINTRARSTSTTTEQLSAPAVLQEFRVGFKSEQGLREQNEDELHLAFNQTHGYLYAGCYDGHGGQAGAQWLKEHLFDDIRDYAKEAGHELSATNDNITQCLSGAFKAADDKLLRHLEELGGDHQESAGSTATVLFLWRNRVVTANVGDSQAYLWRKGQPVALTTPHRVYGIGEEVDSEVDRVKESGGWVYDGRVCNVLAVSRAFGDWEFKGKGLQQLLQGGVERGYWDAEFANSINFVSNPVVVDPDTCDEALTADDEFLVLSSDGLWDVMPAKESMTWARKEFLKGLSPQQVAESLIAIALKRHTTDNTSVVVVDLKGPEYWKQAGAKSGGGGLFGFFKR